MASRKAKAAGDRRITLKTEDEIARMRRAGQIVALALEKLGAAAQPGTTTQELDRLAETLIRSFGAKPSFLGLYGYPATICASVNDEVVHGIPGAKLLQQGDIISFDVGVTVEGMIADGAATFAVGSVSPDARELMRVAQASLHQGIAQAKPGNRVYDISRAVQLYVEAHGCAVVRKLVGHGVGHDMHEPPHVPNFVDGPREHSPELLAGMTLAIEPMVNQGGYNVVQDRDRWTYRTKDRSLSAHFEHTIAITASGCEILTKRAGRTAQEPAGEDVEMAPQAPVGGSQ